MKATNGSLIAFFIALFSTLQLKAQSVDITSLSDEQTAHHVSEGIFKYYKPGEVAIKQLCRRGVIFIRFNVNKQGKIANVAFSKDSATFIQPAMRRAIDSLQKDLSLIYTLQKSRQTVVLPFIYYYQAGCMFPDMNTWVNNKIEGLERHLHYYELFEGADHMLGNLLDMLNFNGKQSALSNCLLIPPIAMGAGDIY